MVSSKARVQRYNQTNAPLHVKRKMLSSHLSDDLRKEFGKRSARVCKGDTVMVVRGTEDIRGIEGEVVHVYTQTGRVATDGVTIQSATMHGGRRHAPERRLKNERSHEENCNPEVVAPQ